MYKVMCFAQVHKIQEEENAKSHNVIYKEIWNCFAGAVIVSEVGTVERQVPFTREAGVILGE